MNIKTTAFAVALLATACGTDPNDRCPDGVYDRTVVLTDDGFLFKEQATLFSPGEDETVPYSASPFLNCRVIGGIVMQSAGAVLDSEHYPLVEELGGITIEPLDNGGDRIVDELSGFENVVRFGGMGNPWNLERAASVREISGFNNVEVVDGSLEVTAILSGFQSLRAVGGTLDVSLLPAQQGLKSIGGDLEINGSFDTIDLPNLESIGGDLIIQVSRLTEVEFPELQRVDGNVLIDGNSSLERWGGFADGSSIGGRFDALFNSPIRDEDFELWVASGATAVEGIVRICANQSEGERVCEE
jgi:hypothetical protein